MKKYISFILEQNSIKNISFDKCGEIFLENCKEFDLDNIFLYRSFSYNYYMPIIIDPKEYDRKSANTKNYYTYIIDNSKDWKDYPKRKNSLICSFGAKKRWIVIPFDGSKWGVCPTDDLWFSFDLLNIANNLMEFNNLLTDMLKLTVIDTSKNYGPIDNTKEEFFDILKKLTIFIKNKNKEEFEKYLKNFSNNINRFIILFDYLKKFDDVRTALENLFNPCNSFSTVNEFKLLEYKELITKCHQEYEIWTDSKCILFPVDEIDILKEFRRTQ